MFQAGLARTGLEQNGIKEPARTRKNARAYQRPVEREDFDGDERWTPRELSSSIPRTKFFDRRSREACGDRIRVRQAGPNRNERGVRGCRGSARSGRKHLAWPLTSGESRDEETATDLLLLGRQPSMSARRVLLWAGQPHASYALPTRTTKHRAGRNFQQRRVKSSGHPRAPGAASIRRAARCWPRSFARRPRSVPGSMR